MILKNDTGNLYAPFERAGAGDGRFVYRASKHGSSTSRSVATGDSVRWWNWSSARGTWWNTVSFVASESSVPWPFWAPLGQDEIGHVLELAAVSRDERFLDLGCGDGRVLEAALGAGAVATGIEADAELARTAQRRLAPWGERARILDQDFHTAELEADVVFAFLSPAVLQRLGPKLEQLAPGTRIVTAWFSMPNWNASGRRGNCFLYRVPPEHTSPPTASAGAWASPGILCFLPSRGRFLVTAELHHSPGPVHVQASASIAEVADLRVGADAVTAVESVAVDLVFDSRPPGTLVSGTLSSTATAAGACTLFCLYRADSWGYWPLDAAMCGRVLAQFESAPAGGG